MAQAQPTGRSSAPRSDRAGQKMPKKYYRGERAPRASPVTSRRHSDRIRDAYLGLHSRMSESSGLSLDTGGAAGDVLDMNFAPRPMSRSVTAPARPGPPGPASPGRPRVEEKSKRGTLLFGDSFSRPWRTMKPSPLKSGPLVAGVLRSRTSLEHKRPGLSLGRPSSSLAKSAADATSKRNVPTPPPYNKLAGGNADVFDPNPPRPHAPASPFAAQRRKGHVSAPPWGPPRRPAAVGAVGEAWQKARRSSASPSLVTAGGRASASPTLAVGGPSPSRTPSPSIALALPRMLPNFSSSPVRAKGPARQAPKSDTRPPRGLRTGSAARDPPGSDAPGSFVGSGGGQYTFRSKTPNSLLSGPQARAVVAPIRSIANRGSLPSPIFSKLGIRKRRSGGAAGGQAAGPPAGPAANRTPPARQSPPSGSAQGLSQALSSSSAFKIMPAPTRVRQLSKSLQALGLGGRPEEDRGPTPPGNTPELTPRSAAAPALPERPLSTPTQPSPTAPSPSPRRSDAASGPGPNATTATPDRHDARGPRETSDRRPDAASAQHMQPNPQHSFHSGLAQRAVYAQQGPFMISAQPAFFAAAGGAPYAHAPTSFNFAAAGGAFPPGAMPHPMGIALAQQMQMQAPHVMGKPYAPGHPAGTHGRFAAAAQVGMANQGLMYHQSHHQQVGMTMGGQYPTAVPTQHARARHHHNRRGGTRHGGGGYARAPKDTGSFEHAGHSGRRGARFHHPERSGPPTAGARAKSHRRDWASSGTGSAGSVKTGGPDHAAIEDLKTRLTALLDRSTAKDNDEMLPRLRGHIAALARTQVGSRYFQDRICDGHTGFFRAVLTETADDLPALMEDLFGNYLCQKMVARCSTEERASLIAKVAPRLPDISCDRQGTRAVQTLVGATVAPDARRALMRAICARKTDLMRLVRDPNGVHVVHAVLDCFPPELVAPVVTAAEDACRALAVHQHGVCVMKKCLSLAAPAEFLRMATRALRHALELVNDQYGNYLVQHIIDVSIAHRRTTSDATRAGDAKSKIEEGADDKATSTSPKGIDAKDRLSCGAQVVEALRKELTGHYRRLSKQKFSSNVVEKCLRVGDPKWRCHIIAELVENSAKDAKDTSAALTGATPVLGLLQDSYGNYVMQNALNVAEPLQAAQLIELIQPHLGELRKTIRKKWERVIAAKHDILSRQGSADGGQDYVVRAAPKAARGGGAAAGGTRGYRHGAGGSARYHGHGGQHGRGGRGGRDGGWRGGGGRGPPSYNMRQRGMGGRATMRHPAQGGYPVHSMRHSMTQVAPMGHQMGQMGQMGQMSGGMAYHPAFFHQFPQQPGVYYGMGGASF